MSDKPIKFYSKDKAHKDAEKLLNEDLLRRAELGEGQSEPLKTDSANLVTQSIEEQEVAPGLKAPQKKSFLRRLFWPSFSAFIIFAAGYEAYYFVASLLSDSWLLGLGAGVLASFAVISGGYVVFKGWKARRRFKKRHSQKQTFERLMHQNSYGKAPETIAEINQEIEEFVNIKALNEHYQNRKQQVHNDKELIQIYSNTVLSGLDKMAIDIITKHSAEAAAMVALSPLAVADMALVAWRGSKMIEQLSRLYGCPQTTLGRLEMTKQVFKNMMFAGASELVADAGVEMLGKSLTATISTKAAQGIGVGLLVARMGLQTMHLCRPIDFDDNNKPKLSHIRKAIYSKVAGLVKTASGSAIEKNVKGDNE